MKKSVNIIIMALVLVLACAIGWYTYRQFAPKGESGRKTITVQVIHGDKREQEFHYQTEEAYLGEVLKKEGLIEGEEGEFGMFITTVDKELADEGKQQWWCITKSGRQVNTSADQTPIADGESYELTLKEGY